MKTQDEIAARFQEVSKNDFFGFAQETLLSVMDFEHAKPHLKEGVTAEEWKPILTDEELKKEALEYLEFAWGKAEGHRGISANRSATKMTLYCWLLGLDSKKVEDAGYAQYGCPKLKAASELLGAPIPTSPRLVRMMNGEHCGADYSCGCGT